jgi:putative addiction module killer protein
MGNLGDVKPLREGISELRIDYGPGYRVYFMRSGPLLIVLLAGGISAHKTPTSSVPLQLPKTGRIES